MFQLYTTFVEGEAKVKLGVWYYLFVDFKLLAIELSIDV